VSDEETDEESEDKAADELLATEDGIITFFEILEPANFYIYK
jgi:hypothetical protein